MEYGLIGEKLGHSFSKEIHESIATYTYDICPLAKDEFHAFMKAKEFRAINVTIPYKKDVIPYLDELDESAKAIGAVNTIVQKDGKLYGHNTDFYGFLYMVKKHGISLTDKKVLVIGNGGASAAIQAVVKHEHAREMLIVDIVSEHGAISYEDCYKNHQDIEIIINTSPIGMFPNIHQSPIDLTQFPQCMAVMDVIYNPLMTSLCLQAKRLSMKYVNGLEMLIAQAKYAVAIFLEKSIDDAIIHTIYQNMLKERYNLVLIGMPSAGKTSIANSLSPLLHKAVIDMDDEIVKKAGRSIPEIFEDVKEEGFRKIESEVANTLAHVNNTIIATGGGCIKTKQNMDALSLNSIIVFIDRDITKLLSADPSRPLSKSVDALQTLYEERIDAYRAYADIIINNNDDLQTCCKNILIAYQAELTKR